MFKKMEDDEDEGSETSTYREFQILCENYCNEKYNLMLKPKSIRVNMMDLKELDRLQMIRHTSKRQKL